ncbi:PIG-L deacetylase family protein [Paenibacillus rhizophilus]|uniref:PIG-L family deacetylase n=1 Tax=Paenibacillus rhizophilus TaxID=1850366 RepID=A0A3N9PVU2_9BACL|nr:PIG-L family deacetylase [Paenibacillus rhizophilus]RQW09376.1 PIG-L family deacetylase [Paenibacillus rhizophilus]
MELERQIRVIVIGAHPDEADMYAGGTAALFAERGHKVKFLSLTNGDCGHYEQRGEELARRRKLEAQAAADCLGIEEYEVLDTSDGTIEPTLPFRNEVIRQIRRWKADIVITFHPEGGISPDNRYTGLIVSDAVPFTSVRGYLPDEPALTDRPLVLLMPDTTMIHDYRADIVIDVEHTIEKKLRACDAHATQFYESPAWHRGNLDQLPVEWEDKKQYLLEGWSETFYVSQRMIPALEQWYGEKRAAEVRYAEPFEIARYSRPASMDELRQWLPMLAD